MSRRLVVGPEATEEAAAACVRGGGLLVYPTETVYGLGGDARRPDVAARARALKGRDGDKPMLALTDAWSRVEGWQAEVSSAHRRVMQHEPPLAVTLLFRASARAPHALVSADGFVGLRRTADPFCRALIRAADAPLLSTSANPSGRPSPSGFKDLEDAILAGVDLAVDAGTPLAGTPSTVLAIEEGRLVVVREGAVSAEAVHRIAGG